MSLSVGENFQCPAKQGRRGGRGSRGHAAPPMIPSFATPYSVMHHIWDISINCGPANPVVVVHFIEPCLVESWSFPGHTTVRAFLCYNCISERDRACNLQAYWGKADRAISGNTGMGAHLEFFLRWLKNQCSVTYGFQVIKINILELNLTKVESTLKSGCFLFI